MSIVGRRIIRRQRRRGRWRWRWCFDDDGDDVMPKLGRWATSSYDLSSSTKQIQIHPMATLASLTLVILSPPSPLSEAVYSTRSITTTSPLRSCYRCWSNAEKKFIWILLLLLLIRGIYNLPFVNHYNTFRLLMLYLFLNWVFRLYRYATPRFLVRSITALLPPSGPSSSSYLTQVCFYIELNFDYSWLIPIFVLSFPFHSIYDAYIHTLPVQVRCAINNN